MGGGTEEILHKRGGLGKKYFKEGLVQKGVNQILWEVVGWAMILDKTMFCSIPILLDFFTSLICPGCLMFVIPGKNFALLTSVLKQESYLLYVRKEIKTPIFKNPTQQLAINKLSQHKEDLDNKNLP